MRSSSAMTSDADVASLTPTDSQSQSCELNGIRIATIKSLNLTRSREITKLNTGSKKTHNRSVLYLGHDAVSKQ